jgi:hypothetical protein
MKTKEQTIELLKPLPDSELKGENPFKIRPTPMPPGDETFSGNFQTTVVEEKPRMNGIQGRDYEKDILNTFGTGRLNISKLPRSFQRQS